MASNEPPIRLTFQGVNELWDALSSMALARFVSGEEAFAETFKVTGVARAADLVPIDSVRWQVTEDYADRVLARGPGWSVCVQRWRNGTAEVAVTAVGAEELAKAVCDVRARSPLVEPKPETVEIEFWYGTPSCLKQVKRRVDVPAWESIAPNYPSTVRDRLGALMELSSPGAGGRLLLWHGPPGTGKTTAIRALVRAWAGWCRGLFVVDAERFLGEAGYMMSVLLEAADPGDDDDPSPRWRLLVFEDADELLRADAKRESGQSLSRLLSLSDGFIGQGLNVLVLLTTNEPIGRLHPAVARPGRCLADVEFRSLSREEATALIGADTAGELTLAEVFERRGELTRVGARADDPPIGQYL
ncbi:MAG TPA: DUF5925 domain-containing protein [Acidimicrobiales bacterium]|nr:DUF5925 domain-containing protein [Acidimicrobiales bacterium]